MQIDIVTIFPDFFRGPLDYGIIRRARHAGLVQIEIHDLREFTRDRHRTVDDRPFGGGEGMVLKPEPVFECVEELKLAARDERQRVRHSVVLLSAQGLRLDQNLASELARLERLVLICGRYEGVDERVGLYLADREISIGDYVLSGGELAAAVVTDSVARLLPGAVGNERSTRQESFWAGPDVAGTGEPSSTCASRGLLDYPHYTRPADFHGWKVPEVLISGNHEEIRRWRRRSALQKTIENRPDLLDERELSEEDKELLAEIRAAAEDRSGRL